MCIQGKLPFVINCQTNVRTMCTRTHRYINVILHYVMNTKFLTLSRNSIKPERQDVTEFQQRH